MIYNSINKLKSLGIKIRKDTEDLCTENYWLVKLKMI